MLDVQDLRALADVRGRLAGVVDHDAREVGDVSQVLLVRNRVLLAEHTVVALRTLGHTRLLHVALAAVEQDVAGQAHAGQIDGAAGDATLVLQLFVVAQKQVLLLLQLIEGVLQLVALGLQVVLIQVPLGALLLVLEEEGAALDLGVLVALLDLGDLGLEHLAFSVQCTLIFDDLVG